MIHLPAGASPYAPEIYSYPFGPSYNPSHPRGGVAASAPSSTSRAHVLEPRLQSGLPAKAPFLDNKAAAESAAAAAKGSSEATRSAGGAAAFNALRQGPLRELPEQLDTRSKV